MEKYSKEYSIERNDIGNAGTVASLTKRALKNRGLSREFIKQVTIGVYEAEINVVIHSYGRQNTFNLLTTPKAKVTIQDNFIEVTFVDIGPGIPNIAKALTKGYSTASSYAIENGFGAGMGLPNMKAVSDEMDLQSSEEGTKLCMRFNITEECFAS